MASIRGEKPELASIGAEGIVPEKLKSGDEVIVVSKECMSVIIKNGYGEMRR